MMFMPNLPEAGCNFTSTSLSFVLLSEQASPCVRVAANTVPRVGPSHLASSITTIPCVLAAALCALYTRAGRECAPCDVVGNTHREGA